MTHNIEYPGTVFQLLVIKFIQHSCVCKVVRVS